MKKFLIIVLSFFCIICAGCAKVNFDLIITSDGAVFRKWQFLGTTPFTQEIENIKINNEKLFPDLKIKTVAEGEMHGYEFSLYYPDIESFAQAKSEHYAITVGKNKGISRHKSWFFDEYDFDFFIKGSQANVPVGATVNQAMFSEVVYDNTIRLPYPAESHNADTVLEGGKALKWDLAPVLLYGGEKHMNVRFKIWHKDKLFVTAAIELLLLAATIFFFIKARAEEFENIGKDFRFKRNVFAGLFIALGIISAYLILMPVTFTEADIISVARN